MSDQQKRGWLARWRARPKRRQGRLMDRMFGAEGADSEEKTTQRHTGAGEDLAAIDRRHRIQGGAGGGPAG
jgi:hypothetical protein